MRAWLFTTTLGGALAVAGVAGAACNIDEAGLSQRHEALSAERGALTDEARQAFHSLRRTAQALGRTGFEAVCDQLVDTALSLIERDAAWTAEAQATGDPAETVGALNLVTFAAAGRPIETADLVGRPVHSTTGARLGEVEGVLLDQSRDASHLILAHGGFWEEAERTVAVPSTRLLLDPSSGRLFSEIPAAKLAEAPEYDRAAPWRPEENDAWYDARAAEAVAAAQARALEERRAERDAADAASAAAQEADAPAIARESGPDTSGQTATKRSGPKRIRIEKDRPEQAAGSND